MYRPKTRVAENQGTRAAEAGSEWAIPEVHAAFEDESDLKLRSTAFNTIGFNK